MSDEEQTAILLVDDRPENLVALEAILSSLGHRVVSAGSGEEALKRLLAEDFAVVLLDVQMPGMDGFETARHMKQRERTRSTPIIFLTALDRDTQQAFRGYAVGAVDYLTKPFDPWLLRAKVEVFIDLHRTNAALERQSARLATGLAAVENSLRRVLTRADEEVREEIARCLDEVEALRRAGRPPQAPR